MHAMRRVRREVGQDHRYAHTLRVARFAERLARKHGEDPHRARQAGLFHDLARLWSPERLLEECRLRRMDIDAFERANPVVLHARLGAEIARESYGIEDEAILSAIRKHTVAAADMNRLDIILYLADGLEPGRDFAERPYYARIAESDLEAAMRELLGSTIRYLHRRGLETSPQTQAAANAFGLPLTSVSERSLETITVPTARPQMAAPRGDP